MHLTSGVTRTKTQFRDITEKLHGGLEYMLKYWKTFDRLQIQTKGHLSFHFKFTCI